ncbi:MAG: DUF4159 domain-containing protein [Armatimonadota bacterium]
MLEGVTIVGVLLIARTVVFALCILAGAVFLLINLYAHNRLLFWCLFGAFVGHLCLGGIIWGAGALMKRAPKEVRIAVNFLPTPPQPKKLPVPEKLALPAGRLDGDPKAKQMPKGKSLNEKNRPRRDPGRPMVEEVDDGGDLPIDPEAKGPLTGSLQDVVDSKDVAKVLDGVGNGGQPGLPEGEGSGSVPMGFPQGKIGGRVYFIRLKHGSGAWGAFDDGTRRLLSFLNQYFPCESESRAMTSIEARDRYIAKGALPSFFYLYCDESFSLNSSDVIILRDFVDKGGFLFLDSRAEMETQERVKSEMSKVLPGSRLTAIAKSHPINSFLFRLSVPGVGENTLTQKNYGITRGGRLVVFYTMGNFSHMFSSTGPGAFDYITAQYQMAANVMVYGITRGNATGITRRKGANAAITTQALEKLGLLDSSSSQPTETKPGETVKVKPTTNPDGTTPEAPPDEPDEIKL